jgi:thiamine pyrophosphate-dependent acetolactate synthase large subunit-like protein
VLIYGSAIARGSGWDQAVAFAETLGAPVWAAPASERSPFPENHPLYAGGLTVCRAAAQREIKQAAVQAWSKSKPIVLEVPISRQVPLLI